MNAKLIVEGKEFDIEILDPELQKLVNPPNVKQTGYEEQVGEYYYYIESNGDVAREHHNSEFDDGCYKVANYHSDETIAKNNARADTLLRQLRRYAAVHNDKKVDWLDETKSKWMIGYNYFTGELETIYDTYLRCFGSIYFTSAAKCKTAIELFRPELIWYFTEYKDTL